MSTEAQQAASRANGAKSNGPKSPQGKERSSQNARKDGLFAQRHLHPDEAKELPDEFHRWLDAYDPQDTNGITQALRCALASVRLKRLFIIDTQLAQHRSENALNDFDAQAANHLDDLIAQLKDRPHSTIIQMEQTLDGIDWLIEQWHTIDQALDLEGALSLPDFTQALLLHGLHPDERRQTRITRGFSAWNQVAGGETKRDDDNDKSPPRRIDPQRVDEATRRLQEMVAQHIARLEERRPAAAALAARNRARAPILAQIEDTPADARRHRAETAAGLALDRALRHLGPPIQQSDEPTDDDLATHEQATTTEPTTTEQTLKSDTTHSSLATLLLAILLPLALLLGHATGRNHPIPNTVPTIAAPTTPLPTPTTAPIVTPQAPAGWLGLRFATPVRSPSHQAIIETNPEE